jgi:alkaline phosphatase D
MSMLDLSQLAEIVRYEGCISRRLFLAYAASLSGVPLLGRLAVAAERTPTFSADPFSLGVASGDPNENSVVLWTRLAPQPIEPDGGMPTEACEVAWEIARDEALRDVVQRGTAVAAPQLAHSVHVEVAGLEPDRWYWYRFRAGDAQSAVGRTRTMPAAATTPRELRFAFTSCQNYCDGLFTAYDHMSRDELDLVLHLGDYIYEGASEPSDVRQHAGKVIKTLDEYRARHAQYKTDPLLQGMHARCPWIVTWDDHEVANDYASDISESRKVTPAEFLLRRAAAYQAYYEHMPLRATSVPHGPNMQLYRGVSFGKLANFLVLDTRQYRSDQPEYADDFDFRGREWPRGGTILGSAQNDWLQQSLTNSPATWNVLAQQVMMATVDVDLGEREQYSMDKWPGYPDERRAVVQFLRDRRIPNPVVLTGDIHSNWVNDLRVDDRRPEEPIVATEFVGTSLSSSGNGEDRPADLDKFLAQNPCVRFHNRQRGYVRCTVTPQAWRSDFQVVPDVLRPGGAVKTRASFVVEAGRPGAQEVY